MAMASYLRVLLTVVATLDVLAYVVVWVGAFYATANGDKGLIYGLWPTWALIWYPSMCAVAILNTLAYIIIATTREFSTDGNVKRYQQRAVLLAGPYVLTCAWRSLLPNAYFSRYVWWDSPMSSILLARTMSTVSELSWIAQISSSLAFCSNQLNQAQCEPSAFKASWWNRGAQIAAKAMFGLICIAECCSFIATIHVDNLFFAIEESLWGLAYLITMPFYLYLFIGVQGLVRDRSANHRSCIGRTEVELLALLATIFCFGYLPWVALVDVPPYVEAYQQQIKNGSGFLSFTEGVWDALTKRVLSHSWSAWGPLVSHMVWRATYFGPNVWACVALACAPRLEVSEVSAKDGP